MVVTIDKDSDLPAGVASDVELNAGDSAEGFIDADDADGYRVNLEAGVAYVFSARFTGPVLDASSLDPTLTLFDPSGTFVATADDVLLEATRVSATFQRDSSLYFIASETGLHTINLEGALGTSGDYSLDFSESGLLSHEVPSFQDAPLSISSNSVVNGIFEDTFATEIAVGVAAGETYRLFLGSPNSTEESNVSAELVVDYSGTLEFPVLDFGSYFDSFYGTGQRLSAALSTHPGPGDFSAKSTFDFVAEEDGVLLLSLINSSEFDDVEFSLFVDGPGDADPIVPPERVVPNNTERGGIDDPFSPRLPDGTFFADLPLNSGISGYFQGRFLTTFQGNLDSNETYVVSVVGIGETPLIFATGSSYESNDRTDFRSFSSSALISQLHLGYDQSDPVEGSRILVGSSIPFGADTADPGDYRLSVVIAENTEADDDVGGDLINSNPLELGTALKAQVAAANDSDFFEIVVEPGRYFGLSVAPNGSNNTLDDIRVRIWARDDSTGEQTLIGGNTSSTSSRSFTSLEAVSGTTLFAEVSGRNGDAGSYVISAIEVFDTVGDDTTSQTTLEVGNSATRVLQGTTDQDWFAVSLEGGKRYRLNVDGGIEGFGAESTKITVHDVNGNVLSVLADDPDSTTTSGTFLAPEDGTYFVAISDAGDAFPFLINSETYTLSIEIDDTNTGGGAESSLQVNSLGDVIEGDSGATELSFNVTRSGDDLSNQATVSYEIGGTVDSEDVVDGLGTGSIVFGAGETTKQISISVIGDLKPEDDEIVGLTLVDVETDTGSAVTIVGSGQAEAKIINDDEPPTVAVEAVSATVLEGEGFQSAGRGGGSRFIPRDYNGPGDPLEFLVTREGSTEEAIIVDYSVTLGDVTQRPYTFELWFVSTNDFAGGRPFELLARDPLTAFTATTFEQEISYDPQQSQTISTGNIIDLAGEGQGFSIDSFLSLPDTFEPISLIDLDDSGLIPNFFTGGAVTGGFNTKLNADLVFDLDILSLGEIDIRTTTNGSVTFPEVVAAGQEYSLTYNSSGQLQHIFMAESSTFDGVGAGLNIEADLGFTDLAFNAFGADLLSFSDLSVIEADANLGLFSGNEAEFEVLDGIFVNLFPPEARSGFSYGSGAPGEAVTTQSSTTIAGLNFQLLEILDNAVPVLDIFQEDVEFENDLGNLTLSYTLLDIFARFGFRLASEYEFTPELVTSLELDGDTFDVSDGTDIFATAPDATIGSINGNIVQQLGGTLSATFSLVPFGGIGFELLSAGAQAVAAFGSSFDFQLGPLLREDITFDFGDGIEIANIGPIELSQDLFEVVTTPFQIDVRQAPNPESAVLTGSVVIEAGETDAVVTLEMIRDRIPEANQDVLFQIDAARTPSGSLVDIDATPALTTVVDDDDLITGGIAKEADLVGQPLLITFDGLLYDFQAIGEFTYLLAEGPDAFELQVRFTQIPGSDVTSQISSLAFQFEDVRLQIDGNGALSVDGEETAVPTSPGYLRFEGTTVYFDGSMYIVQGAQGDEVHVGVYDGFLGACIFLSETPVEGRNYSGLLGDADDDPSNDLALRDGTNLGVDVEFNDLYGAFSDAWRVTDDNTLFEYAPGRATADFTDISFPTARLTLHDLPDAVVAAARTEVDAFGAELDPLVREAAVLDYALTGNPAYIQAAAMVVAQASEVVRPTIPENTTPISALGVLPIAPVVNEADGVARFLIYRTGALDTVLNVDLSLGGDSDGLSVLESVQFAVGEEEIEVSVSLPNNEIDQGNREFALQLAPIEPVQVINGQAEILIVDDDAEPLPTLSLIATTREIEEEETASFELVLDTLTDEDMTVTLAIGSSPLAAIAISEDFADVPTGIITAVIAAGTDRVAVKLQSVDDATQEETETLTLRVVSVENATLDVNTATVTIVDNDTNTAPVAEPLADVTINERQAELQLDGLDGVTDAEDDPLSVSDVSIAGDLANLAGVALNGTDIVLDASAFAAALGEGETAELFVSWTLGDSFGAQVETGVAVTIVGEAGPFIFFVDSDGDGFGTAEVTSYTLEPGLSVIDGDLDDTDDTVYPYAPEINDGKDNDQDGDVDEDNRAPEIATLAEVVSEDAAPLTIDLLALASDPDGDALNLSDIVVTAGDGRDVALVQQGDSITIDPTQFEDLNDGDTLDLSVTFTVDDGIASTDGLVTVRVDGVGTVIPPLNPVEGTGGSDNLVGTDEADAIRSLAGSYDRMFGGGGADQFIFGEESSNGVRERDVIMDYEVGIDSIVLEAGTSIASIRETSSQVVVFLDGDRDAIYVRGDGVTADNLTIIYNDMFEFV